MALTARRDFVHGVGDVGILRSEEESVGGGPQIGEERPDGLADFGVGGGKRVDADEGTRRSRDSADATRDVERGASNAVRTRTHDRPSLTRPPTGTATW